MRFWLFSAITSNDPKREYSGLSGFRACQPPVADWKKSTFGATERSKFAGSMAGVLEVWF